MRGLSRECCMQLVLHLLTLFFYFKQYEAYVTTHLVIGRGPENLTLELNAPTEILFSFSAPRDNSLNYTVYVQHRPLGAPVFDRKCILRQSRESCTSHMRMCRCLERAFGSYSLQHVFTKTDEGRWLFTVRSNRASTEDYLDIIVKDISGGVDGDKTISYIANTTTTATNSAIIIAVVSPCAVLAIVSVIVIVLCLRMRRDRNPEGNSTSCDDSGVTARGACSRRQQQQDTSSAAYASPASVVSLREYAGVLHPPQQRTRFTTASSNDSHYANVSCQEGQWRGDKSDLASTKMDDNGKSPGVSIPEDEVYETPEPPITPPTLQEA